MHEQLVEELGLKDMTVSAHSGITAPGWQVFEKTKLPVMAVDGHVHNSGV